MATGCCGMRAGKRRTSVPSSRLSIAMQHAKASRRRAIRIRLLLVLLLVLLGIAMELNGYTDIPRLVAVARELSQHWWLVVVLILGQALLFTFALAGSLFLWIAAPLYSPPMATLILAAG